MKTSGYVPEFQAVVLAGGKGSRFTDVTQNKAKCLLPVGNLPLLWYPLNMLQRNGFQEVIVVVSEACKSEVNGLAKRYGLDMKLDVVALSAQEDPGTAEALRLVHDRISSPRVIVLSGDLITDLKLHHLTDLHRAHRSALTALFAQNTLDHKTIPVPGPKSKPKKEKDFVGIDKGTNQLCYISSEADLDEFLSVRRSLLMEHPRLSVFTNLIDAHFYIFESWVLDFLAKDESISSIKGELVPHLVKKQHSKNPDQNQPKPEDDVSDLKNNPNKSLHADDPQDIFSYMCTDSMADKSQELSTWTDHTGDLKGAYRNRPLRVYAHVMDTGTCLRANNLYAYCELNRQISRWMNALAPHREPVHLHPNSKVEPRAQVGVECQIGEGSFVSNKTTLKNSILGVNCKVDEKVKLLNCIIMDNVHVKEGCQITGSLICDGVIVPERCEIKDCIVGKSYKFVVGGKHANETLGDDQNRMMEI
ncbi:hypothetical protein TCAL_04586 [Tigriopus californicus]|uniref:Translation initiation factor eIF2B subunit gamma n=1 Tax=Tigriopus californicus TaxID=6832 RepID=A0A553PCD1_TIGCA|nr:translation initiation factor eIF-2B subunit gamma-like isoform X1 [Tigriopus californicus]TRY75345.1 hypothetical protein TCAL_04586 [Tigriopus californicus]|eukprot:TCALIF_04586-PA protein Name:"Similar to Eif2b3 Translation initiation factor eIF-2B subunit gamma (Rattus norvegicus)" AED:0.06 eAED:0.06 QI:110/1/1/1/1/1/4/123/474